MSSDQKQPELNQIYQGDSLTIMRGWPDAFIHCCVTSPPYWNLRDYGVAGQMGLEKTPEEYIAKMVMVFREVRRVLRDDGILWINLGDSYAGSGKGPTSDGSLQKSNMGPLTGHPSRGQRIESVHGESGQTAGIDFGNADSCGKCEI